MTVASAGVRRKRVAAADGDNLPDPARLLAWYDRNRRALPWRAAPGERPDPYRVWVSEIMLQQTRVETVARYYPRFLARFPTVAALAEARLDDVLRAWAGLGYYSRARNLHACARAIVRRGGIPDDERELRTLPGVGAYTAAAIAAIAFDRPAVPVDGNVERVVARLFAVETPLPAAKPELRRLAAPLLSERRPGDFAQALMDLGALLCTPRRPACGRCPWNGECAAVRGGDPESFPRRAPRREGELRRGIAFFVQRADGAVLVRRRPLAGLLGGMIEIPTTEWTHAFDEDSAMRSAPHLRPPAARRASGGPRFGGTTAETALRWRRLPGLVRHVFTHFPLELAVFAAEAPRGARPPAGMRFVALRRLDGEALPALMRKVARHALDRLHKIRRRDRTLLDYT